VGKVQVIRNAKNEPAFAVVPWNDYVRLAGGEPEDLALLAMAEDARKDDRFPAEVAKRLIHGENVLKVLREWRGMTQEELGRGAGLAKQYISQIETGRRNIGTKTAPTLARALHVRAESLLDI
jgi:DNA-binding XRE family transcriptional regulator